MDAMSQIIDKLKRLTADQSDEIEVLFNDAETIAKKIVAFAPSSVDLGSRASEKWRKLAAKIGDFRQRVHDVIRHRRDLQRNRTSDRGIVVTRGIICHTESAPVFVCIGPEVSGKAVTKNELRRALRVVICAIEKFGLPKGVVHIADKSELTFH